jgi:hypothetical protein
MNIVNGNITVPYLKSLASCLKRIVSDGYTEDFKVEGLRLASISTKRRYQPQQVHIVNSFRFQGNSDPSDSAFIYVIETTDGLKGTLVDATGKLSNFIQSLRNGAVKEAKNRS